jgi:hypothetical protein
MGGMRTVLIVIALALLARVVMLLVLESRQVEPVVPSAWDTSSGPLFEVRVLKPLSGRPFGGLLPDGLFGLPSSELRFDHASRGAQVGNVEHDRLELSADGWELIIETDGEGRPAPGTRLVFPIELGGRQLTLRCRPADRSSGYLRTTLPEGSDELDGSFLVEFSPCENAETGKTIEWPSAPLTVSGSFVGLPLGRR